MSKMPKVGEGYSLVDAHMALVRALQAQKALLKPFRSTLGLTTGQPRVISYLAVMGSATQREIADYLSMDPAQVCRILDALEKNGFVTTSANPADRRTKKTELTEAGQACVRPWDERCHEVDEAMLAGFSATEREQFMDYLERARVNLVAKCAEEKGQTGKTSQLEKGAESKPDAAVPQMPAEPGTDTKSGKSEKPVEPKSGKQAEKEAVHE